MTARIHNPTRTQAEAAVPERLAKYTEACKAKIQAQQAARAQGTCV